MKILNDKLDRYLHNPFRNTITKQLEAKITVHLQFWLTPIVGKYRNLQEHVLLYTQLQTELNENT